MRRRADRLGESLGYAPRSSAAACSGGTALQPIPVPSSSPPACVSRVDPPAEATGVLRGGSHPQAQRRARAEAPCQQRQPVVQQARAGRPVVLEARASPARDEHERERVLRGVRAQQHRLVVDRDDPLAAADLGLHEILEQVRPHRAGGVRPEALALARNGGRHEVQRVQLGVRVSVRGGGLGALVDAQVQAGGRGVRAHPLAPRVDRHRDLLGGQLGERVRRLRGVDDDLVRAVRRQRSEELRLVLGRPVGTAGLEQRLRARHDAHAPAGRVGPAAAGPDGVELGRGALLVTLCERIAGGVDRLRRRDVHARR